METPPPEVLALVVADYVYQDVESGKLSALGIRSLIGASSFPFEHPQLAVYVVLANGRGATEVSITLVDADEEHEPLAESNTIIEFASPLAEIEVVFDLRDLTFPTRGEYKLQLRSNGHFLRERRLVVFSTQS